MILSFKKEFEPLIKSGSKIHTIREDAPNRWNKGRNIHFATGVRSKNYNCFKEGEVKSIQYVFMTYHEGRFELSIGNNRFYDTYLNFSEIELLAKNDGFENLEEFQKWFITLIEKHPEHHFSGKIIHWTNFKYKTK